MRRTIVLTVAAVFLAAGIAISQQPPGGGTQPNIPAPPVPEAAAGAPNSPGGGYAVVGLPPGASATYAVGAPYGGWGAQPPTPYDAELAELNRLDHELELESRKLVSQLAQSPDNDAEARDQLKAKLRETLDKQFEAQLKLRETEVARIEERVKKLRDVIKKRSAARKSIVDRRQQQLIDDAEGLGWSPSAGPGGADPFSSSNNFAPAYPVLWNPQIGGPQRLPAAGREARPSAERP